MQQRFIDGAKKMIDQFRDDTRSNMACCMDFQDYSSILDDLQQYAGDSIKLKASFMGLEIYRA